MSHEPSQGENLNPEKILQEAVSSARVTHQDPSAAYLIERSIVDQGTELSSEGALVVKTGSRTGRSPNDKYIVRRPEIENEIWWGKVNRPIEPRVFSKAVSSVLEYFRGKELYQINAWIGADPRYTRPIKVITDSPWHALFARQIFRRTSAPGFDLSFRKPIVILAAPYLTQDPATLGTNSEAGIMLDLVNSLIVIYGTQYAGEIKKSAFTAMNYYLPHEDVFPMHCSANVGLDEDVALFFGLSGTGKTSLSADSRRKLVGDDEHGWSDRGVFNLEGGCYAKCINLSKESEPEIWGAVRFGTILENVVLDANTRIPDYSDDSITENTRATYPLEHNPMMVESGMAGQPKTIFFLTADAFGILPPIARLTPEQAMYYYISGYTAKLAGTEAGMKDAVQATFSSCFGEPFLPLHPQKYAEMLRSRILKGGATCYLLNTGWTGGPYGVGKRISIKYTRAMVQAAIEGKLDSAGTWVEPVFGLHVPNAIDNVPTELLNPRNTWADKEAYDRKRMELAQEFVANMAKFSGISKEVLEAGPFGTAAK